MTPSEEHLAVLSRRSFLGLWSWPNVFTLDGKIAKELCDLLVVFGDDVIIFSDKDCRFAGPEVDIKLGWSRWYRKAILASAKQVTGAERALLLKHPLFLDQQCREPFELSIPETYRVHRVLTVSGAQEAALRQGACSGGLIITASQLKTGEESPFHSGCVDEEGRFFHVWDRDGLNAVLSTMDTAPEFLSYISAREELLRSSSTFIAASEPDLVGLYLESFDRKANCYRFPSAESINHTVDGSRWDQWQNSPARAARIAANHASYGWDRLVDEFGKHAMGRTSEATNIPELKDQELLLRWFAREPRLHRRALFRALSEMLDAPPGSIAKRYYPPVVPVQPYWAFLVMNAPDRITRTNYRRFRRNLLEAMLGVVRLLNPGALDIVGLAVGYWNGQMTEDAAHLDARSWSAEQDAHARSNQLALDIFRSPERVASFERDFPI